MRTCSRRAHRREVGEIDIDFVLHGDGEDYFAALREEMQARHGRAPDGHSPSAP